ncbi:predicted protein [Postia placenta Mad-698-R]|uniref:Uncharacterized protein n=1 Tax=Postia placenta MAD-698-R-SB12 TaxID=670580 RepID=A0A1X6N3C2_9APHY|nr:hypothetical protein POSPLADRAFT_1142178 [Postia placenta MAD-698-R-SB12]EED84221.1 predicted protein [Postia placenta Mad-698-R]OSX63088.1 hypothetical protein POSPLADRAFT_1142178 [Postia placenta MAD-698-R-SB12]
MMLSREQRTLAPWKDRDIVCRPKKIVPTVATDLPSSIPIYVEIQDKPQWVKKRKGGGGNYKVQPPQVFDPITFTMSTEWDEFLALVATAAMTTVDRLILSSLNWQWTKTNSSAKGQLPLKSPKGYKIMLDNIKASNLGVAGMLFVSMGRPRQPQQELPPWAVAATLPSQSQSESHNDESDTKSSKKLSLDKKLEPIMAALINKSGEYAGRKSRIQPMETV